jgi:2-succinyl-6-hydroxy-2,4-cyclohexadiene-1-carboxylate synthase
MPTTIAGIPLHITTVGDPALPRIVFLHGFLGCGSDWLPIARELHNDYCCMMVDLPGHGFAEIAATEHSADFFARTVDALAELLRRSASPPCSLVGYSMGGRLALSLLLRHPELFTNAVIISATAGLKTEKERIERLAHDEKVARKIERNFEGFIASWYEQPLFATLKNHPIFTEIECQRKVNNPQQLALALRLLGTGGQPSLWETLHANRLPVCFFVGEKDERYVEIGSQMVTLCPKSALEIFPHCGHTLHLENRALFLERLRFFFNKQDEKKP